MRVSRLLCQNSLLILRNRYKPILCARWYYFPRRQYAFVQQRVKKIHFRSVQSKWRNGCALWVNHQAITNSGCSFRVFPALLTFVKFLIFIFVSNTLGALDCFPRLKQNLAPRFVQRRTRHDFKDEKCVVFICFCTTPRPFESWEM